MSGKSEIIFGMHSVCEALRAGRRTIHQVLVADKSQGGTPRFSKVEELARKHRVPLEYTHAQNLDKLTGQKMHQGVAARVSLFPVEDAVAVPDLIGASESPCFVLVLENLEDPHNLGALVRTALCAGVDYIVIPKNRSVGLTPTVSRVSAGAMEHARIFLATNTVSILKALKEVGIWVSGLAAGGDKGLYEADLTGHLALVVGAEHKGIRPLVEKECDFLLSIPNLGPIDSLNASVAGGIAMFEALRQRSQASMKSR